jgi:hypothetical protein
MNEMVWIRTWVIALLWSGNLGWHYNLSKTNKLWADFT